MKVPFTVFDIDILNMTSIKSLLLIIVDVVYVEVPQICILSVNYNSGGVAPPRYVTSKTNTTSPTTVSKIDTF